MALNTSHLGRCIDTLEAALEKLRLADVDSIDYEVYRNAVIKGFELTLETAGKLLRRALREFTGTPRIIDELSYKEVFRHALRHGLISTEEVERWFEYRDNRNTTAHDYGAGFAEDTLTLLPRFVTDARALEAGLRERLEDGDA